MGGGKTAKTHSKTMGKKSSLLLIREGTVINQFSYPTVRVNLGKTEVSDSIFDRLYQNHTRARIHFKWWFSKVSAQHLPAGGLFLLKVGMVVAPW